MSKANDIEFLRKQVRDRIVCDVGAQADKSAVRQACYDGEFVLGDLTPDEAAELIVRELHRIVMVIGKMK